MKKVLLLLTFFMFAVTGFAQTADIVVTNTNNQSVYVAGTEAVYTVTVTNFGPSTATNVVVQNPMPVGITTFYWEGSNNSFGSNSNLYNTIATLQAGQFVTYVITVEIPLAFTGNLISKATAYAASPADNYQSSNEATDTDIVANADVKVVTTDNTLVYTPGQNTVYTVTVTNNGPTDAVNIIVKNDRPAGITAQQFSWTGSNGTSGTGVVLDDIIPLLGNGEIVTYTITVNVPATYSGPLINKTNIFVTSKDLTESDWESTDTDVKTSGADIVVNNTDNSNFYVPGQPRVYTVKVSNMGAEDATGVHIVNALPAGVTTMSWTGSNATSGNGALDVTLPTLANQAVVIYTVTVQVPAGFTGNLTSQTVVTSTSIDPNPQCDACIDIDTAGADIVITNTNNQTEYVAGSIATYIVTVTNNGPDAAENVIVSDTFTAGVTVINWTGTNGTNGGGNFNNVIATLANGATITYTIKVQIPANLTTDLVSLVAVSSDTPDPFPTCVQCTDTDTSKKADIQVTFTDDKTTYIVGTSNVYTITVTNNGPSAAENVSVSNAIPAGITQFSWTGSNGTSGTNAALIDLIPVLANGATVIYTVTLQVPPVYTANLTSTVKITTGTIDPTPVVQIVDVDTLATTGADIVITNTNGQTTYVPGTTTTYTLTVTNNGPQVATGINVTNAIPAGTTVMSWTGNSNTGTGALTDNIASLAVNASVVYTIIVQIPAGLTADLISQAAYTATTTDPNPACTSCIDKDTLAGSSDIVVTNTANNTAPVVGTSTTFTVTVTNNGPADAANVVVQSPLPAGITSMSWTGSNGSSGTGAINNTIASLPNTATVIYTVTYIINNGFVGNLSSTATGTISNDPNTANSTATATVTPVTGSNISITNTDGVTNYTAGLIKIYTITVTNEGTATATNIDVDSFLPAGIPSSAYSWTGNGHPATTGIIDDTITTLAAGASVVYTVTIKIPSGFDQKENLITTVNAVVGTFSPVSATDIDTPKPFADLIVKKTDNQTTFNQTRYTDDKVGDAIAPILVKEYNTYTITIINYGPSDALQIKTTDLIPVNPNAANGAVAEMTWTGSNGSSGTGSMVNVVGSLAVGETVTYTVKVLVPQNYNVAQPYNNFINTATVTSDTEDPTTSNNNSVDVDTPASNFLFVNNDPAVYSVNGQLSGLAEGFVQNVLVRSHCAQVSNFQMASKPGDPSWGVGYFNRNNSDFPIEDGIILVCGEAASISGPNDGNGNVGGVWPGSTDFNPGFMTPEVNIPINTTHEASFLKFDFVPSTPKLSFNFAFASDEYNRASWECIYSDVFAFILTDITAGTQPKNLAVVPNTNIPVKVTTIHLPGCDAGQNPAYFGKYNNDPTNPAVALKSAIVLDGQTRLMQAKGDVIPGHQYSIKLMIANQGDDAVPSAVFIEGGSFAFEAEITGDGPYAGLDDFGLGREVCDGEIRRIKMGDVLPGATYSWKKNGVKIDGETNNYLDVASSGVYTATVTFATGCKKSDDIQVLFTDPFPLFDPADITICDNTAPFNFNIDQDTYILNGSAPGNYEILYYEDLQDAKDYGGNFISSANLANYVVNTEAELGKTIYARIMDLVGLGCVSIKPFKLYSIINRGTISYPVGPFCTGQAPVDVINSTDLTPGGKYIATPSGLNIDAVTGKITFVGSLPNTYSVVYSIEADAANICPVFNTPLVTIQVDPCITCDVVASGPTAVCMGDPINLTAVNTNNTPGATVTYAWTGPNGFNSTSQNPSVTPLPTTSGTYTYQIISSVGGVACPTKTVNVIIHPTPAAAFVSSSTTICTNSSTNIIIEGTPGAFVTYTKTTSETGSPVTTTATIQLSAPATGLGTFSLNTGNLTFATAYELVKVVTNTTPACETLITAGTVVTISVGLPDATISITDTVICSGTSTTFTITGTPGGIVNYTKTTPTGSSTVASPPIPASGILVVNLTNLTENTTITLTNITSTGTSSCSKALAASVSVTVNALPVASFTATTATVCSGQAPVLNFTGTPNATVTFSDGTATYTAVLDAAGLGNVTNPALPGITVSTTYTLQSVVSSGAVPCTNTLSQSLIIGINALPAIVTPPAAPAAPVCIGSPFTLSVTATGTNISYQWYHTNMFGLLPGETGPTYTDPSAALADGGDYFVVVTNACSTVTSAMANVVISQPTVITVPPSGSGAYCAGQTVNLSFTATGVGMTYQWYRGTTLLPGETNTTLSFVASATTAGSYTCVISNSCSPVTTNPVVITVDELPLITNITSVAPVCTGTGFSITVTATGAGLTYKWFHGPVAQAETSATFTVASASMADAGTYRVEVSGTCAPVAVSTNVNVVVNQAPAITLQPTPLDPILCSGQQLTLNALASGGPGVTYQWMNGTVALAGQTSPTLIIPATLVSDSGSYTVVVTNANCAPVTSNPTVVTINQAPVFTQDPADQNICEGNTLTLTAAASGTNLTYQWLFNGGPAAGVSNQSVYTITSAQLSDSGNYTCVVSNTSCPPVTSKVAVVLVNALPDAAIVNGLESEICAGYTADVKITGTKNAVVTYTINGGPLQSVTLSPAGEVVLGTGKLYQTATYELVGVTLGTAPFCPASLLGLPTSTVVVKVNPLPIVELDQDGYICVDSVTGATTRDFTFDTGLDDTQYAIQWFLNGVDTGVTGSVYVADEAGAYRVEVTDRTTGCYAEAKANVVASIPPVTVTAEVITNYFDENGTVEVTVTPAGDYEYRLDDGPWQDSNVFANVRTILSLNQTGTHRLYARDLKACDEKYADVTVIDYPKYFTPNGDGYHDTWNISVLSNQPNAKIYIFDRFGKLLKQISTTGAGWDGTFNGQPMPGDDYWFVVKYLEESVNKEFKAHFSLKR